MGHSVAIRNCYLGGIIISIIYIDKTIAVSAKIIKFWNTVLDLTALLDKAISSFTKHALALIDQQNRGHKLTRSTLEMLVFD